MTTHKGAASKPLIYTLIIHDSPYHGQGSFTGYQFARAAIELGHTISSVFFYANGVLNGSAFNEPTQDETNITKAWQQLAHQQQITLRLCIAASQRRGITNVNLAEDFEITGLGPSIEHMQQAHRVMNFGG